MKPHLDRGDVPLFNRYLARGSVYFEFGSGGSTVAAAKMKNIRRIYSVENDATWVSKVKTAVNDKDRVTIFYIEMDCGETEWGNPGSRSTYDDWVRYSRALENLSSEEALEIDLFMIDGRFRVACLLNAFARMSDAALVMFDDFSDRPFYHIVLDYFEIVERGSRMVVLKKRSVPPPDQTLIERYEKIAQ
uniref:Methyltransferase n=1 Tax=viral metagenome TaxID=1070528 RepID=A0A6C0DSF8_9ZZZZ